AMSLIVVVTVMMALSTMAIVFARTMVFNRMATSNYCNIVDAKLAAYAGLDRALAILRQETIEQGHIRWHGVLSGNNFGRRTVYNRTNYNCWQIEYPAPPDGDSNNNTLKYPSDYYDAGKQGTTHDGTYSDLRSASSACHLLSFYEGINGNYSYSGSLGLERPNTNGKYSETGVRYDVYGRYEKDGTTYALKIENSNGRLNVNSHIAAISGNQSLSNEVMQNILRSLARRCGISSDTAELTAYIKKIRPDGYSPSSPVSHEALEKEVKSWAGVDDANKAKFLNNLTTDSWINHATVAAYASFPMTNTEIYREQVPAIFYRERRSPIDVNTASIELIASLIENIKGKAVFYNLDSMKGSDKYETETVGETVHTGNFTVKSQKVMAIGTTTCSIDFSDKAKATNIAQAIINSRNSKKYTNRRQFEAVIDGLSGNFTVAPTGISTEDWNQACRDALKSNFNPNATENFFNPNEHNYRRVSKGLLFDSSKPTHTTELSFDNHGTIRITSLGQITAESGTKIVGSMSLTAVVKMAELMRHSTQREFLNNGALINKTISYPVAKANLAAYGGNPFSGGIEPEGNGVSGDYIPNFTTTTTVPNAKAGITVTKMKFDIDIRGTSAKNLNLAHDGVVSRTLQYPGLSGIQYYADSAHGENKNLRDESLFGHVGNYEGSISFWIKPEESIGISTGDSAPELPLGILSVLTKSENKTSTNAYPGFKTSPYNEGIQMLVYKNALGILRVSRLYYTICHSSTEGWYGAVFEGDADPKRLYPRHDVSVDLTKTGWGWKAHTWHYVQISWNDKTGKLDLWIDGKASEVISQKVDDPNFHPEFCVLNETDADDCFFINGFARNQKLPQGYFHFGSLVDYPGNATIAGLSSSKTYKNGLKPSKYPASSTYSGIFRIGCLFSASTLLQAELSSTLVNFKTEFKNFGYDLPIDNSKIAITVNDPGKIWTIEDKELSIKYVVAKEAIGATQKLNVYRGDLYFNQYNFIVGPMRWTSYPNHTDNATVNATCTSTAYGALHANSDADDGGGIFPANTTLKSVGNDITYTATLKTSNDTCPSLDSVTIVLIYSYPRIKL
ncbi:MAG: hypothetical protein KJ956_14010, partial [Actinobacteria bacterium]|nr:hypothetical protein [Actinomycetota bacterium]